MKHPMVKSWGQAIASLTVIGLVSWAVVRPNPRMPNAPKLQSVTSSTADPDTDQVEQQDKQTQGSRVKIAKVNDGDTVTLATGERIRLCGIDAPEKAQTYGPASTSRLRRLVGDGWVDLVRVESDRYGRTVGEIWQGQINVNAEMVRQGMAYHYAKYSGNCPSQQAIMDAEKNAQARKVGVWAVGDGERPWDYRRR